jgi:basic amino acid/polyamine antiporter, APA family
VSIIVALGMKTYARIQKFSFYGGMLGLLIVIVLLLTGSPKPSRRGSKRTRTEMFGAQAGVYDATVALGMEAGAHPVQRRRAGLDLPVLPYLVFFNLWPNWGATLYGEVRGATDFKRNITGMGSALLTTLLGMSPVCHRQDHRLGLLRAGRRRRGGIMPGVTRM